MYINNVLFNCELSDIISEVRSQLAMNGIDIGKTRDAPNDIMVQCPFHGERRPSAGIRKDDGQFNCFACHESHSLAKVISQWFGKTDDVIGAFGWQWLLKNFATMQVEERKDVKLDFSRNTNSRNNKLHNDKCDDIFVSDQELDSYRYTHPYMYKRGLTDEVIETFDIGYDEGSRCITFPIRDINGKTLFIARRSVDTKFFNYPEGVEKPLYGLYEYHKLCTTRIVGGRCSGKTEFLRRLNEIIVCEGMFDALSFWVIGKYAVALNGTGSELQFKQLRNLLCRKLILATDNDEAGQKARNRIRKNVKNKIITEYIYPDGYKDANDCLIAGILENLQEVF